MIQKINDKLDNEKQEEKISASRRKESSLEEIFIFVV